MTWYEEFKSLLVLNNCGCGQQRSSYTPNSTAARRSWRRWPHLSCSLDSQCSSHREEEEEETTVVLPRVLIFSDVNGLKTDLTGEKNHEEKRRKERRNKKASTAKEFKHNIAHALGH